MFHFLNLNIYALKQGYDYTNKANLTTRISKHASEIDVKGHVKLLVKSRHKNFFRSLETRNRESWLNLSA
jgi:hypothetical protein